MHTPPSRGGAILTPLSSSRVTSNSEPDFQNASQLKPDYPPNVQYMPPLHSPPLAHHNHPHRSNSAPQSPSFLSHQRPHTSSGNVSDGGTSVGSVDMKRLLSKPAMPSSPSSRSHSDSEPLSPSPGSRT